MIVLHGSDGIRYALNSGSASFTSLACYNVKVSPGFPGVNGPDEIVSERNEGGNVNGNEVVNPEYPFPPGFYARVVRSVAISNTGDSARTVTVTFERGEMIAIVLAKAAMDPGDVLGYESGTGWRLYRNGAICTKAL